MSTTVVDIGCVTHGEDESTTKLIERFHPDVYIGFDPLGTDFECKVDDCVVYLNRAAAWIEDGTVEMGISNGLNATVIRSKTSRGEWDVIENVPCFDFSRWLLDQPFPIDVLKIDAEGAEYSLLSRMIADGSDRMVDLLLVEWHDDRVGSWVSEGRSLIESGLRCRVEEW